MDKPFSGETIIERIRDRLRWINQTAGDTVGGALEMSLLDAREEDGHYLLQCITHDWMRNVIGTLHGGSCAVMVDQAMGCVANCLFDDESHAPTSQLQLNFYRPMRAGERFLIRVQVVNASRSQIHMAAQVFAEQAPDKLCVGSTAIFFRGKKQKEER